MQQFASPAISESVLAGSARKVIQAKKLVSFYAGALMAIGLVSCSGGSSSAAPSVNLEEYASMSAGEIWVVLDDGTVDKFENSSEGYA